MSKYQSVIDYAENAKSKMTGLSITDLARAAKIALKRKETVEQLRKVISRSLNKVDWTPLVKGLTKPIVDKPKPTRPKLQMYEEVSNWKPTKARSKSTSASFTISKTQKPRIVGIIGDTHEPFTHKDYRDFCNETFNKYKVERIVHIGDEIDNHAISFHDSDPNGMSAESEAVKAQEAMDKWYRAFPEVSVIIGNHTALPFRQANAAGLPKRFIKTYEEAWQAPKGWKWHNEIEIDHVKYVHGMGCSGQNGAINLAIRSRQSTVIGHIHSFAGVNYHANNNDLIFGMNTGCGIDVHAYAFEYAKPFVNKPTLGCGIVIEGQEAIFVPMKLGKKYEWVR